MRTRRPQRFSGKPRLWLVCLALGLSLLPLNALARESAETEHSCFTLRQALIQAYDHNRRFALEQNQVQLAEEKDAWNQLTRPTVQISASPISFRHDSWPASLSELDSGLRTPSAQLSARLDVTDAARIDAAWTLALEPGELLRSVSLSYSHNLTNTKRSDDPGTLDATGAHEQPRITIQNTLVLDVMASYYAVLQWRQQTDLLEVEQQLLAAKLERAIRQERSEVELLRAHNNLDEGYLQLNDAYHTQRQSEQGLAMLLELPAVATAPLEADPQPFAVEHELWFWTQAALESSTVVLDRRKQLWEAVSKLEAARADHGWDINLHLSYEYKLTDTDDYRGSISVRRSLYPADPFQIRSLELRVIEAELALETAVRRVQQDIETAYRRVESLDDRLLQLSERLVEADAALERELRRVTAGLSAELDYQEATLTRARIALDRQYVLYEQSLASAALIAASGFLLFDRTADRWWMHHGT